jgi:ATP-dependent DNA helicase RecQ
MAPLEETLKAVFGFDSFREGQRDVVDSVLAGQDVLAVFPTGGGKSLLYQLPAASSRGRRSSSRRSSRS